MEESAITEIEFEHDDFTFDSIEEELVVDERCCQILKGFYYFLQAGGMKPEKASELAFCADFYVRDYLLDFGRQNIVRPESGVVKKFAASWFITHTLDPELRQLELHLDAIRHFYGYLHNRHLVSQDELDFLTEEAGLIDYYRQRIETFLNITGDGFVGWDAECPAVFERVNGAIQLWR